MIRVVARNVAWNWAGMGVSMLAGFVLAPFLVHRLGQTGYGLWILIASLIYYFGLLDLGIRAAVGRQIAFFRAKEDELGVNQALNTAMALLCLAGLVALAGTLLVVLVFFRVFDVPPEQVHDVRLALILVGITLAAWVPLNVFDAVLWAYQRFDAINIIDISGVVVRVVLTLWLIGRGHGLVALSLIHLLAVVGFLLVKAVVVFRLDPGLRIGPRYVSRQAARGLLGIGLWNTLLSLSYVVNGQMGSVIIGARLAVPLVTPFSIASRLVAYGRDFLVASTGVLTPVAITYHAESKDDHQRQLFLKGGKYCLALTLFFVPVYLLLGESIVGLWMGPKLRWAWELLFILAVGEALPMSQWVSYSIILGKYRHRALALMGLLENVCVIVLALWLVRNHGLVGVCVAFALPGTICRGAFQLFFAGQLVGVSIRKYVQQVLLPVGAAALLPIAGLVFMVHLHPPATWTALLAYLAGYGLAYLGVLAALAGYGGMRSRREEPREEVLGGSRARWLVSVLQSGW